MSTNKPIESQERRLTAMATNIAALTTVTLKFPINSNNSFFIEYHFILEKQIF